MVVVKEQNNMFWGITLDGGKRYSQTVEQPFHISMAAIEPKKGDDKKGDHFVSVMIIHEKAEFLLCSLNANKLLQQPLDLNFTEGEEVTFYLTGNGAVHLTGFLVEDMGPDDTMMDDDDEDMSEEDMSGESDDSDESDDEDDEDAKVPTLMELKNLVAAAEADSDDVEWAPESGKRKKKEDKKTSNKKKKVEVVEADDDDDDDDDDDFIDALAEEESDEDSELDDEDDLDLPSVDSDDDAESIDSTGSYEKPSKQKKQKNKAAEKKQETKASKDKSKDDKKSKPQTPSTEDTKSSEKLSKSQKKRLRLKQLKESQTPSADASTTKKTAEPAQKPSKTPKKRVVAGGTTVEEVKEGHGPEAKSGKMVGVFYTGKLLQNGKMFDSCTSGKPFKFKLGKGEVIKGWDHGVAGMKVGSKRRITIPPAQGYGSQRSGPIPANSTLVFDVELKSVS